MMAKSPAERKAAQRARQSAAGERKLELILDAQELDMLERNCAARRPGCAPPGALVARRMKWVNTSALLIRQDDARMRGHIKAISTNRCGKCGDSLPVKSCPCDGDSACWVTQGWHETKLEVICP